MVTVSQSSLLGSALIATYSGSFLANSPSTLIAFSGSSAGPDLLLTNVCVTQSGGSGCGPMYGVSGGAPEIDGSLAPKVGFLLGCFFLMFGRKKQKSEPMMTA